MFAAKELEAIVAARRQAEDAARTNPRVMRAVRVLAAERVPPDTARRLVARATKEHDDV